MSQHGWDNCPYDARAQVATIRDGIIEILRGNLSGVYLHGSLALGCFNPERSDIDLLVVTPRGLSVEKKRQLIELLLQHSGNPDFPTTARPVEISFLRIDDLHPWRHPAPFDLHYSERYRAYYGEQLRNGGWQHWNDAPQTDPDLAAHVTLIVNRGICLHGAPIPDVFPAVPREDYFSALLYDFEWSVKHPATNPLYCVLSTLRELAYFSEGLILSKDEGGQWGLERLPELHGIIGQALMVYRGDSDETEFDPAELEQFAAYIRDIQRSLSR